MVWVVSEPCFEGSLGISLKRGNVVMHWRCTLVVSSSWLRCLWFILLVGIAGDVDMFGLQQEVDKWSGVWKEMGVKRHWETRFLGTFG